MVVPVTTIPSIPPGLGNSSTNESHQQNNMLPMSFGTAQPSLSTSHNNLGMRSIPTASSVPFSAGSNVPFPTMVGAFPQQPQLVTTNNCSNKNMIVLSKDELKAWENQVVVKVEARASEQQLHRIAEFGRAHANLLQEAKAFANQQEIELRNQLSIEKKQFEQQAWETIRVEKEKCNVLESRIRELETLLKSEREKNMELSHLLSLKEENPPSTSTDYTSSTNSMNKSQPSIESLQDLKLSTNQHNNNCQN